MKYCPLTEKKKTAADSGKAGRYGGKNHRKHTEAGRVLDAGRI